MVVIVIALPLTRRLFGRRGRGWKSDPRDIECPALDKEESKEKQIMGRQAILKKVKKEILPIWVSKYMVHYHI